MNEPTRPTTRADYEGRMLRVLVHIQNHLDEALCLEELADVAHFSPFHFHRIFTGMVGESLQGHVRRLRLERAAHRLKFTDQPVTRIAFEAGYETHEAFSRAFKNGLGASPSEFRKQNRPLTFSEGFTGSNCPGPAAVPSGVHFSPDGTLNRFQPLAAGDRPMEVRIETVGPLRVVFVRHTGPYNQVGETWQKLFAWAGPRGLVGPMPQVFGLLHDDPAVTSPDRLRYDACLLVGDHAQPEADVGVQTVAGGSHAVTRHLGPYENLGETYARLCGAWLPASGKEARSAPALEFYRNAPMYTPPEKLMTDIYLPLEN